MGQRLQSMLHHNRPITCAETSRNNSFKVRNFDDAGIERTSGHLIIFPDELVLHQKATDNAPAEIFRWPLRSLRRYGYDSQTFSFESGRRCLTGPGVYAFKCKKAIGLFNTLQMHIQNATTNETHPAHLTPGHGTPTIIGHAGGVQGDNQAAASASASAGHHHHHHHHHAQQHHQTHSGTQRYTATSELSANNTTNNNAVNQLNPAPQTGANAASSSLHLYMNSTLLPPVVAPLATPTGAFSSQQATPTSAAGRAQASHANYVNTAFTVVTRFDSLERLNPSRANDNQPKKISAKRVQYIELDLNTTSGTDSKLSTKGIVAPVNTPTNPTSPDGKGLRLSDPEIYFNITANGKLIGRDGGLAAEVDLTTPPCVDEGDGHDYMNLGLGMGPMQSSKPVINAEPMESTESYTMIDFAKTAALASRTSHEDEAERKTRHDSSYDDLVG